MLWYVADMTTQHSSQCEKVSVDLQQRMGNFVVVKAIK